jgi:hypothetical protein
MPATKSLVITQTRDEKWISDSDVHPDDQSMSPQFLIHLTADLEIFPVNCEILESVRLRD